MTTGLLVEGPHFFLLAPLFLILDHATHQGSQTRKMFSQHFDSVSSSWGGGVRDTWSSCFWRPQACDGSPPGPSGTACTLHGEEQACHLPPPPCYPKTRPSCSIQASPCTKAGFREGMSTSGLRAGYVQDAVLFLFLFVSGVLNLGVFHLWVTF